MADEMMRDDDPETVRRTIEQVAPGAKITSGYRTPERNRRVGGAPNSWHTRGTPDQPLAFDIVPPPGMSMAELNKRVGSSGLVLEERLNEGDHVHIAFRVDANGPGARSGKGGVTEVSAPQDPDGKATPKATVTIDGQVREGTPDMGMVGKTDDELRAAGYRQDDNGLWYRFGTAPAEAPPVPILPPPAEPLDDLYAARQEERANAAIDREIADDERRMAAEAQAEADKNRDIVSAGLPGRVVGAVARDVGMGVLESVPSAIRGVQNGINETLDLIDEVGDWLEKKVPLGGIQLTDPETGRLSLRYLDADELAARGGGNLPDLAITDYEPRSTTGAAIEGISQFMTGWATGGRVLRPWRTATRTGQVGKALAQGALADFTAFDGNEPRLANMLEDHAPEAIGSVVSYLAANDEDPELIGRMKNAIEGGVLGVVADGVIQGIRAAKAARLMKAEARAAARAEGLQVDPVMPLDQATKDGEAAERLIDDMLGREDAPSFRVKAEGEAAAVAGISADDVAAARPADNVFDLNFRTMNTPEDIQNTAAGLADALRSNVDLARRGARSWDQTVNAAGRVDVFESMAKRRVGDAANAETLLAYRYMANASAEKVLTLARSLKTRSMTDAERVAAQFAFRRSLSIHSAIQNEFMGARAEAGRALNAMRIPAGSPATKLRQIDQMMAEMGSRGTADDLADVILEAAAKGGDALATVAKQGWMARTRDMVQLIRVNGLLSGPATIAINAIGTPMMMALDLVTRAVAPRMASMLGGQSATQVGEAMALIQGYAAGFRDVFRVGPMETLARVGADGARALRQDGLLRGMAPGLDDAAARLGVPLRAAREEAGALPGQNRPLSAAAWRVNEDSTLGRFLDAIQMAVELPSNALALTDDFWKVISARGEMQAQAVRKTLREGLQGDAAAARVRQLVETPTDDMLEAMERQMKELTFTRSDGKAEQKLNQLRRMLDDNSGPVGIGSWLLPFVRTPMNLTSLAVRTGPLAPLSARFRNALAEGGAAAETAKAQMAVGTALWSLWMGAALEGDITGAGPTNPEQRAALTREDEFGNPIWQPYSVRIGGRWYSYARLDPFGSNLSLIGDLAELLNNEDWNGDRRTDLLSVSANAVMALGGAFFDKTMLRGAFEFSGALTSGRQDVAEKYISGQATSAIPFSGLQRTFRRGADPYVRETHDVVSAMRNTVPGLSEGLPASRDLWGKPRTYVTGLGTGYDAIAPIQTRREGATAIDLEILNNGVTVSMPDRTIMVNGEAVSLRKRPDIYSEYVRMAGEPAFEHLNAVAEGRHPDSDFYYSLSDGPGGGKADYIKTVVSAYRDEARMRIMEAYGTDLTRMAADEIERRQEIRAPL